MAPSGPTGPEGNPFEGFGFLGDLARLLQGSGAPGGDAARQFAQQIATAGVSEPNPDPMERIRLAELARVAEMKVADVTGLATSTTGGLVSVVPVTRGEWARRALDAYRPVLERLSSLTAAEPVPDEVGDDPMSALFGGLAKAMAPMLLPLLSGSLVGQLATRSLGQYDLPLPRPPSDELVVVAANVEAFATEWSLPGDDLRLWLCLSELATHAVLGVPHVRSSLERLLEEHASAFRVEGDALESKVGELDLSSPDAVQELFGDPLALLGAVQSPEQRALLPRLEAIVAVVVGYVDHVVDTAGRGLIGSFPMLTEALHRRRVEATAADTFVESLFGLSLGAEQYERGSAFVHGVVERAGTDGLARLWEGAELLPTPAEVDAPGLWLARIELVS